MSELGKIKPLVQTIPIRSVNKDTAKKEQKKKEKGKGLPPQDDSSDEHVNEYI